MTLLLITEQIKRNITGSTDAISILRRNQLLQLNVIVCQGQHCRHIVYTYACNRTVGNFQRSSSLGIIKAALHLHQHISFALNFRRILHNGGYNRRVSLHCCNLYVQQLLLDIYRTTDSNYALIADAILLLQLDVVKMQHAAFINASFKTHLRVVQIMDFYVISCSRNFYTLAMAFVAEQQLTLHQTTDIIILARHAQQATNIAPKVFYLAFNIVLKQVNIKICTIQAVVDRIITIRLLKGSVQLIQITTIAGQRALKLRQRLIVNRDSVTADFTIKEGSCQCTAQMSLGIDLAA